MQSVTVTKLNVSRMAFQAARQLELEQDGVDRGGGQMALPQQFVNRHRRRPELLGDRATRRGEPVIGRAVGQCGRRNRPPEVDADARPRHRQNAQDGAPA